MFNRVATAIAIAVGGGAGYYTTQFADGLIATQLSDPVLGGFLWPVVPTIICVCVLVLAAAAAGLAVQFIDSHGTDSIAGRDAYRLVGVAGLVGTGAAVLLPTADILSNTPMLALTVGSPTPLVSSVTAAAPVFVWFFILSVDGDELPVEGPGEEVEVDSEDVSEASWRGMSDDVPDPGIPLENCVDESLLEDSRLSDRSRPRENQSNDHSEYQYDWEHETGVSFDDVGGMNEVKLELQREIILPLANDEAADELGVTPSNLLFHGPPGTGKTYLAKALATELQLPAAILTGSSVNSKWINESAEQVRTLFEEAHEIAATEAGAVIFIDEIDSVLKERTGTGSAHTEDAKVVNEFLNHLEETGDEIVFVGATNRLDSLDSAATRAGRIDKKVQIGKPDQQAREAILRAQLDKRSHVIPDEMLERVAAETEGYVAADLEQLVTKAAKQALQSGDNEIRPRDVANAMAAVTK